MAKIYDFEKQSQIIHNSSSKSAFLKYVQSQKNNIEQAVCIIKTCDGDMDLIHINMDFPMWCIAGKLLDYQINNELEHVNEES